MISLRREVPFPGPLPPVPSLDPFMIVVKKGRSGLAGK